MAQKKMTRICIFVFCVVLSIITLLPLLLMLLTSVKSISEINAEQFVFFPKHILFSNYAEAMKKGDWTVYFKNTIIVTAITVGISLVINSLAGYAFARIPLINTYAGLILPYIAGAFGVFLCRQFYMNIPQALDEAAKIDGCSRIMAYAHIFLPLSKPVLATLAVLKSSQTWNDYLWPLIMISNNSRKTVQVALVSTFVTEVSTNWNLLMAGTAIVMLPLVILFLFTQKYFVEGVVSSGIKG